MGVKTNRLTVGSSPRDSDWRLTDSSSSSSSRPTSDIIQLLRHNMQILGCDDNSIAYYLGKIQQHALSGWIIGTSCCAVSCFSHNVTAQQALSYIFNRLFSKLIKSLIQTYTYTYIWFYTFKTKLIHEMSHISQAGYSPYNAKHSLVCTQITNLKD